MRIALTLPYLNIGGIGVVASGLCKGFEASGHQVDILTTYRCGNSYREAVAAGWPIRNVSNNERFLRARLKLLHQVLSEEYDVVISNHSYESLYISAALRPDMVHIAVLHTTDDAAIRRHVPHLSYLNAVVGVSPAVVEALTNRVPYYKSTLVIPNGVDVKPRGANPAHNNPLTILYVGRLDIAQKNICVLPEIGQYLRKWIDEFRFVIAGDGENLPLLRSRVSQLGLDKQFEYLGGVSRGRVQELMQQADYLVLPSNYEGFGLVVVEAMGSGLIPLTSNLPVLAWILGDDAPALMSSPDDPAEFARKIVTLRLNPTYSMHLRERLIQRQNHNFTEQACVNQYLALIERTQSTCSDRKVVALNKVPLPFRERVRCSRLYEWSRMCKLKVFRH